MDEFGFVDPQTRFRTVVVCHVTVIVHTRNVE